MEQPVEKVDERLMQGITSSGKSVIPRDWQKEYLSLKLKVKTVRVSIESLGIESGRFWNWDNWPERDYTTINCQDWDNIVSVLPHLVDPFEAEKFIDSTKPWAHCVMTGGIDGVGDISITTFTPPPPPSTLQTLKAISEATEHLEGDELLHAIYSFCVLKKLDVSLNVRIVPE